MGSDQAFTVFVGIDWADAKHDVCMQAAGSSRREFSCIAHEPAQIESWACSVHERFGGPVAVALELTKGPIVYALQKYDFIVLFPINPATLTRYRQAFKPSGAKDDPSDAELALDLLVCHRDKFTPLQPQSAPMRTLIHLVEQRRQLVNDKLRFTNRIGNALKQYYPQALAWFEQRDTTLFCEFIHRWPTLAQVKRAHRAGLERFFQNHNVRFANVIEERIRAIKAATALTRDEVVISSYRLQVEALIPRLLAAFGEQRERFRSADGLQRYSGIAPVTERSGKKNWVHWRWQCPTFLRQTFVEWAAQTINKSFWAGAFYRQHRDQGSTHQAAVRALAYKWIRILYRCWQTCSAYNEVTYLNALQRRGSPLFKHIAAASETC
jgi:transposase